MSDERGSGILVADVAKELRVRSMAQYKAALAPYVEKKLLKKKQVEDMVAGYEDGWSQLLARLSGMGVIVVATREELEK